MLSMRMSELSHVLTVTCAYQGCVRRKSAPQGCEKSGHRVTPVSCKWVREGREDSLPMLLPLSP